MSGPPFGFPSNWSEEDKVTHGEMLARCMHSDCRSPLKLYLGLTVIIERCQAFRHIQHIQPCGAPGWRDEGST